MGFEEESLSAGSLEVVTVLSGSILLVVVLGHVSPDILLSDFKRQSVDEIVRQPPSAFIGTGSVEDHLSPSSD